MFLIESIIGGISYLIGIGISLFILYMIIKKIKQTLTHKKIKE